MRRNPGPSRRAELRADRGATQKEYLAVFRGVATKAGDADRRCRRREGFLLTLSGHPVGRLALPSDSPIGSCGLKATARSAATRLRRAVGQSGITARPSTEPALLQCVSQPPAVSGVAALLAAGFSPQLQNLDEQAYSEATEANGTTQPEYSPLQVRALSDRRMRVVRQLAAPCHADERERAGGSRAATAFALRTTERAACSRRAWRWDAVRRDGRGQQGCAAA